MPVSNVRRPQRLQRERAQVRNDLLLGELTTPLGKSMLSEQGSLQAILFHLAFWHMDLGYFGRGLLGSWPQADVGVVLWSLSFFVNDTQTTEKLTRLCTIPEP